MPAQAQANSLMPAELFSSYKNSSPAFWKPEMYPWTELDSVGTMMPRLPSQSKLIPLKLL